MDKQQIQEWQRNWLNTHNKTGFATVNITDMLSDFAAEFVPQWVSVEQGGYQYYKTYSVYDFESGTIYQAWPAWSEVSEEDIWTVDKSDIILPNVTHWMPLPTTPNK